MINKIIYIFYKKFISLPIINKFRCKYFYKNFSILIPITHELPEYQRIHPKYDRHLPIIAKFINKNQTIVDIGANVGDSLASMVDVNNKPTFLCIEADDNFFKYLEINVSRIKVKFSNAKIFYLKKFIGKKLNNISLEKKNGTAKADLTGGNLQSETLDDILKNFKNIPSIKLLKSDTDGFDYDVLDSSMSTIQKFKPILFFECEYREEFQKISYKKIIKKLHSIGYIHWIIFDNYGELILNTNDLKVIFDLIQYIWKQNLYKTKRTIYYYDILLFHEGDKNLMKKVIKEIEKN